MTRRLGAGNVGERQEMSYSRDAAPAPANRVSRVSCTSRSPQDNVLHRGCLHEMIAEKDEHREGVIVKNNHGCMFRPA